MSVLREWLVRDVEQSLAHGLQRVKSLESLDDVVTEGPEDFRYSEKNFSIKLDTSGLVQIIGPSNKSPHVLYLSDGFTKIGVEFDAGHVSTFAKKNACKYPEGLIGRTVALTGVCHLICDAKSGSARLSLHVTNFKSKGCHAQDRSSRPIENEQSIRDLLSQISEFMNGVGLDKDSQVTTNSQPQASFASDSLNFATQIPNRPQEQNTEILSNGRNLANQGRRKKDVLSLIEPSLPITKPPPLVSFRKDEWGKGIDSFKTPKRCLSQPSRPQESPDNAQSKMNAERALPKSGPKGTTLSSVHSTTRTQMAPVLENTNIRTEKWSPNDAKPSTMMNEHTDQHARIYAFQKTSRFVPRCYERIEKDQILLLDCEDSWFDMSQDKARIPQRVLQDQIKFHESQAAVQVSVNNDESGQDNDSDAHEEESVNDSEDDHADAQVFKGENATQHTSSIDVAFDEGRHLLQSKKLVEDSTTALGQGYDSGLNQKSSQVAVSTQESDAAEIDQSGTTDDESDFSQPSPAVNSRPRKQATTPETGSPVSNNFPSSPLSHTNTTPTRVNNSKSKSGITTDLLESDSFRKCMVESPAFSVTTPNRIRAAGGSREAIHRPLSSSQTDEEDLELDIPHALGEEIHKSSPAKGTDLQVSPQRLSTRINHSELLIQVEKTPSQKKRSNIDPSPDVFIPGTYTSSQPRPIADESKRVDPIVASQSTNTDCSERATPLPLVPMTVTQKMQDAGSTDKSSSSVQISRRQSDPPSSAPSIIDQTLLVFQASSPVPIANLDGGGDMSPIPNQQSRPHSPLHASNVREERVDHGEQSRKRRKIKDLAALGFSQEDVSIIDRDQMVRANRREILRRLSSIDPDDVLAAKECTKSTVITEHQTSPTSVDSRTSLVRGEQSPTLGNDQAISLDLAAAPISGSVAADGTNSDASLQVERQQPNLYKLYHRAYPNYGGTERQFVKALVYLEWLGASRRPHESLWDDFVRCYAQDYSDYLRMGDAERLTGIQFYNKLGEVNVDYFHPKPSGRIVTTGRLESALADGSLDRNLVETLRQKYGMASRPRPSPIPSKGLVITEEEINHQTGLDETAITTTHRNPTEDFETPKKSVSRRFFETYSQVAAQESAKDKERRAIDSVGVNMSSPRSARRSLPWKGSVETPNKSSPPSRTSHLKHTKAADDKPASRKESLLVLASEESAIDLTSPATSMRSLERPSKSPSSRPISQPSTSRSRAKVPSDGQREIEKVLKQQVQTSRVEKSRTQTPRSSILPPSFSLGKLLAKTCKKRGGVLSRTTPRSSFSTKSTSSNANNDSPK